VPRIVSLVPAVTEILFAIGAGPLVVGVSSYDSFPPGVQSLPRVGALINPDFERILALRPGIVIVYTSQRELQARLARAGVRTFEYRHGGITAVLDSIRSVGGLVDRQQQAQRLAQDIRTRIDRISSRVASRPRPRTLLVFERQPRTLRNMYVSGGIGFINEMLEAAGGTNVFADVRQESVQPSHETLLTRGPDVIIEVRATGLMAEAELREDQKVWSALPSLEAVRRGRIHVLIGDYLVVPGPRLADGIEALARTLHPEVFR
jgi:iron complex transport system substrate-binding protein